MTKEDIINTYCKIRSIDNTIPDDLLDFMKDAAIEKLEEPKINYGVSSVNIAGIEFHVPDFLTKNNDSRRESKRTGRIIC